MLLKNTPKGSLVSELSLTLPQALESPKRRQGGQRKRWEDNIRKWTGPDFGKSQRAVENREKWRKLVANIICGAPTTLAVKGLMMMMMMRVYAKAKLEILVLLPLLLLIQNSKCSQHSCDCV